MVIGDLRGQGAKEERKRVGLKCRTEEDKKWRSEEWRSEVGRVF
jgi:hypothetical protein